MLNKSFSKHSVIVKTVRLNLIRLGSMLEHARLTNTVWLLIICRKIQMEFTQPGFQKVFFSFDTESAHSGTPFIYP